MIEYDEATRMITFCNLIDVTTGEVVKRQLPEEESYEDFSSVARDCIAAGERFRRAMAYRTF